MSTFPSRDLCEVCNEQNYSKELLSSTISKGQNVSSPGMSQWIRCATETLF